MRLVRYFFVAVVVAAYVCSCELFSITLDELRVKVQESKIYLDIPEIPQSVEAANEITTKSLAYADKQLLKIKRRKLQDHSFTSSVVAIDNILNELNRAGNLLRVAQFAQTTDPFSSHALGMMEKIDGWINVLQNDQEIYQLLKSFSSLPLGTSEQRLVRVILEHFEKKGSTKAQVDRVELLALHRELGVLSAKFLVNIQNATTSIEFSESELAGLTPDEIRGFARHNGRIIIEPNQWWQYHLLLTRASLEATRMKVYEADRALDYKDNVEILNLMLAVRNRIAKKSGFASWREYTNDSFAPPSIKTLMRNLHTIQKRNESLEKAELGELATFASRRGLKLKLTPWNVPYLTELMRSEQILLSHEDLRNSLQVEAVIGGLIKFSEDWLHLRVEKISGYRAWDESVRTYGIFDKNSDKYLGAVAFDLFVRPNKDPGFQVNAAVTAVKRKESRRPFVVLFANFPSAKSDGDPVFLSLEDVTTLFHEFGHVLHYVLNQSPYYHFAPGSYFDSLEFPSTVFESLALHPAVSVNYLKHWQTGEVLSESMRHAIFLARNVMGAHALKKNLQRTFLDLECHQSRPVIRDKIMAQSFGHLVDYDGLYWSYLHSAAMAQQFLGKQLMVGLQAPTEELGRKFRQGFLELGEQLTPQDLKHSVMEKELNFCENALAFYATPKT